MFNDQPITYPDFPVVLERYLGTATDSGSTTTYKILKGNGEYVCRTNVCPLILIELAYHCHKEQRKVFDASSAEALGHCATISEFNTNDLTPELEKYVGNEDNIEEKTDEVPEGSKIPEFHNQYLNVDFMLPCGGD